MRKIFVICSLLLSVSATAFADDITVILNGDKMDFEEAPIIRNDSTLVPFRAIFEKLDMTVQWFGDERRVTAENEGTSITLFIDNDTMNVNGKNVQLLTPPIIYNDFTFVPLRAVSEAAGADVEWDGDTRTVTITAEQSTFDSWGLEVLELVNAERQKNGHMPLKWDDSLAQLAEEHCRDMIERNFFAHDNPDGETPFDRMKNAGLSYWSAGENIAAGQASPEAVVEAWLNSPGHRQNILNEDFEYMGVSAVKGGHYGIYWAQEFARFK